MLKISVIIPVYNGEKTIRECIETTLSNNYEEFEVIVVDDNSKDNTQNIIEQLKDKKLKFVRNKLNSGPSFARNVGIKESAGEIVLLLDSDSYVERNWIQKHVLAHGKTDADIIGGGILGIHKTIYGECESFCNHWNVQPFSGNHYVRKLHLPTNNMSIRRTVFSKIGFFNEDLRTGEDAEFCFRALNNNIKICLNSDIIVYHYNKDDLCGFLSHQKKWGPQVIKMRKVMKMNFHCLIPKSYAMACLYIFPFAAVLTVFIVARWIKNKPSVLLYLPLIFLGKIAHAVAIRDTLKDY